MEAVRKAAGVAAVKAKEVVAESLNAVEKVKTAGKAEPGEAVLAAVDPGPIAVVAMAPEGTPETGVTLARGVGTRGVAREVKARAGAGGGVASSAQGEVGAEAVVGERERKREREDRERECVCVCVCV